eukprot:Gb_14902 [translate_table: standard]
MQRVHMNKINHLHSPLCFKALPLLKNSRIWASAFIQWNQYITNSNIERGLMDTMNPNDFYLMLRRCATMKNMAGGKGVHAQMIKTGFQEDIFLVTNLIDTYLKCGSITHAREVFDKMSERNTVSWNVMIAGYAQHGYVGEALKLFCQMQRESMKPDLFTFTSVIRVCIILSALEVGKQVHTHFIKSGFEINIFVGSALVDMYVKHNAVKDSRKVFDKMTARDVVVWTAVIVGYAQSEYGEESLKLFCEMQRTDTKPNHYTFASVFSACASLRALGQGQQVHAHIIKAGIEADVCAGTALVSMYSKCDSIQKACKVFEKMYKRNVVSWTTMITVYSHDGLGEEALKLFCQMQQAGLKPDLFTFAIILKACASLASLEQGKRIHAQIVKTSLETDIFVGSALVDMYAKCGSIEEASNVFNKLIRRDVASWNAMIAGYAQNGFGKEALQLFEQMQQTGLKPNYITFIGVLSACSHVGLVDEGRYYFDSMSRDHGITPTTEHFACLVDLLARAGHLDEAEIFINGMPFQPSAFVWRTLLGACRVYGNLHLGKRAAEHVFEMEPEDDATYVLLSNIYAGAGMWDNVAKVRNMMKVKGVKKEPGRSWIEVKNTVHAFVVGDRSHPQTREIYAKLERLGRQMKEAGYIPDTNFVLHDME